MVDPPAGGVSSLKVSKKCWKKEKEKKGEEGICFVKMTSIVLAYFVISEDNTIPRRKKEIHSGGCADLSSCVFFVYYESRNRELKRRLINEGRCDD